jgi:signal transduction histidine kinase
MYQHPFKSIPPFTETRRTERREVNLEEVIRNIQMLLPEHVNGSIETRIVLADQELPVMIDMAQIELAVLNLIRNAREAMPMGGSLTIQTGSAGSPGDFRNRESRGAGRALAFVSVSDTGAGMDEQTLSRIFEPFYTTKEGAYRGMGLPTAYHTIRNHSGSINVESRPGHGTTVKVYLPLLRKTPARRKAIPLPPVGARAFLPRLER